MADDQTRSADPAEEGGAVDVAVISSSPLMLLQALAEARAGRRVAVIDRDGAWGGVWQVCTLPDGRSCETACHLIEAFPGVYELLEKATGIPFETLPLQPLRLPAGGGELYYSSRLTIAAAVAMALVRLGRLRLTGLVSGSRALSAEDHFVAQEARLRLLDFRRYLLPGLVTGYPVKVPVPGFAHFTETLVARCRAAGVRFVEGDVRAIRPRAGAEGAESAVGTSAGTGWRLALADGRVLEAAEVRIAGSATLERDGQGGLRAYDTAPQGFFNIVASVPRDKLLRDVGYALYPQDPHVMRVSRIDQPLRESGTGNDAATRSATRSATRPATRRDDSGAVIYLVQFWKDDGLDPATQRDIVAAKLKRAGIIAADADFDVIEPISGLFTPYDRTRQLPEGEIAPGLYVWSSAGNLASGIANWQRGRYRFRRGRFATPVTAPF